jgi:large subunit ribosomal protein L21
VYAIIDSGGQQLRVQVGDVVRVARRAGEVGAEVVFDRVLAVAGGDGAARVGTPLVDGARVRGSVVGQGRGAKVVIYHYKHRQNANRKRGGHRQAYTAVKIDAIEG